MMSCLFKMLTFLLFLSTIGIATGLGSMLSTAYKHLNFGLSWENAQRYCREHHTDLATIYNQSHAYSVNLKKYVAWVGLRRQESKWVWNDIQTHEFKWENQELNEYGDCAAVVYYDSNKKRIRSRNCRDNLFFVCKSQENNYPFIEKAMNWFQAEQDCREHNGDLASFNENKMNEFSQQDFPIWIGLHRNDGLWMDKHWNSNGLNGGKKCGTITSLGKQLGTETCQTLLPFLCMKEYVLVKENKSWEEAFERCRGLRSSFNSNLRFNMLSVQPGDEHAFFLNKVMEADTEEVWTGLRFLGDEWLWINGADMLYTKLVQCPIQGQRCGALSKNDTGTMEARDCSERKNFLCYSYTPHL